MKTLLKFFCLSLFALLLCVQLAQASDSLWLKRDIVESNVFKSLSSGYADRWYRNTRSPSFCRMNLCHGSCADPSRSIYDPSLFGMPPLYNPLVDNALAVNETPCGLRTFKNIIWAKNSSVCTSSKQNCHGLHL